MFLMSSVLSAWCFNLSWRSVVGWCQREKPKSRCASSALIPSHSPTRSSSSPPRFDGGKTDEDQPKVVMAVIALPGEFGE
jgi:hypothetical protein